MGLWKFWFPLYTLKGCLVSEIWAWALVSMLERNYYEQLIST